jgi:hypothetical protein
MIEERRFFLRTALFASVIAVVYWFVSYETAGSVMLLAIGLSAMFLMVVLRRHTNEPERGPLETARHLTMEIVTFEDPEEGSASPLAIEEGAMPAMSYPPLAVAVGAGAVAGGLVFGAWLWLPGAALVVGAAWRWYAQLDGDQTDPAHRRGS